MAKKILVADDEREILDLIEAALKNSGSNYDVVTVSNGSQLADVVHKENPDLLILDILLPGIDGYSLQLQFAQNESTKNMPVIVISALPAAKSLFEKFSQVKMFLSKPFSTQALINAVKEILE